MDVVLNGVARTQFLDAALWYSKHNRELVQRFEDDLGAFVRRISLFPESCPVVHRNALRRGMLSRFPYKVYYLIYDEHIEVLALLHFRRDEFDFLKRL